jgi:hypothetical protein
MTYSTLGIRDLTKADLVVVSVMSTDGIPGSCIIRPWLTRGGGAFDNALPVDPQSVFNFLIMTPNR